MAKKTGKERALAKLAPWIEARQRFHLSHAQVQMARELGLNPKKFGGLANHSQEPWKVPLPQFIEELYQRRYGRALPERIVTLEARAGEIDAKKRSKRERRESRRTAGALLVRNDPAQPFGG